MTIGEYIKLTDRYTYDRLRKLFRIGIDKPKRKIRLGDTAENLMAHRSYKRIGRRVKQVR
jgi:hypothetical protein